MGGVEKACVLPIENPFWHRYFLFRTEEMENIVSLLKNIDISPETYEKISHKNTKKLLGL